MRQKARSNRWLARLARSHARTHAARSPWSVFNNIPRSAHGQFAGQWKMQYTNKTNHSLTTIFTVSAKFIEFINRAVAESNVYAYTSLHVFVYVIPLNAASVMQKRLHKDCNYFRGVLPTSSFGLYQWLTACVVYRPMLWSRRPIMPA